MARIDKKLVKALDKSRRAAFELLMNVDLDGAYANLEMPRLIERFKLVGRDAAFATELGYGTLRMRGLYDAYISEAADRPLAKIDLKVLNVLRLGLHQILTLNTPPHAATSETVDLGRAVAGVSTAGFINAIMRKVPNIQLEFSNMSEIETLAIKYSHPTWIVQSFHDLLGDLNEVEDLLKADNSPSRPDYVAWPGKSTLEELDGVRIEGTSFGVTSEKTPREIPAIMERRAGVQDRGSQVVAEIFLKTGTNAQESWLDLCAGPGGKAAFLYNNLQQFSPEDTFLANEISEHRADLVRAVIPTQFVHVGPGEEIEGAYDRILIDAPCTGLGALRRRPEARWRKSLDDLKELVKLQKSLLDAGAEHLHGGGVIGYVTCSPHVAETRLQVADFLHRHKEFSLLNVAPYVPQEFQDQILPNGTLQLWPHKNQSDAMFLALLKKSL